MGVISSGVLAGLAKVGLVVVSIGALSAGAYFAYQTGSGGSDGTSAPAGATVSASPTAPQETLTPTTEPPTPQPTPTATALPPTQPPPTQPPAPTPDTRVAITDPPTLDQIQLGKDGKYFIADRGDGCTWTEYSRTTDAHFGLGIQFFTDCPAYFGITFRPESGQIAIFVP